MTNALSVLCMVYSASSVLLVLAAVDSVTEVGLQYGALGILGFMVWVNSKERKSMIAAVDRKDEEFRKLFASQIETSSRMVRVAEEMAQAVENCKMAQLAARLEEHNGPG